MKLYIGWDSSEIPAYNALVKSLRKYNREIQYEPMKQDRLQACGLLRRIIDNRGQKYDMVSNAPCSTEFSASRFLVPILCQSGWAMFMDCDMLFMCDPVEIMEHADESKAVMVVKHNHHGEGLKMGGMIQTDYPRKNWSSVILFNCDHLANRRLSLDDVNNRPGRDLHAFYWLHDSEIGELPAEWNWLVNVQPKQDNVKIAHFTEGGPWIQNWQARPYDDIWNDAANSY